MSLEVQSRKRIEWIDIAKAVAIILVGVGHYSCPYPLQIWIYTFHMPLFFILSGCTINIEKYTFGKFILRKAKAFLLPWVLAVCVNIAFQEFCLAIGISANHSKISSIPFRLLFNMRPGEWDPIYWFLPCLFITEAVVYWILKIFKSQKQIIGVVIALGVCAYFYQKFVNILLPWEVDLLPVTCCFLLIGYLIKKYYMKMFERVKRINQLFACLICIISGSLLGVFNVHITGAPIDIASGRYGIVPLMFVAAILLSIGIIILCTFVHSKLINYIGQNSLIFYVAQPITYKISDILLILGFNFVPFYTYTYNGNIFDLIILHLVNNILILIYVYLYKKIKMKLRVVRSKL
ncbi:MAG: acyltransferase [Eubacterium sp.]|nr:acyltransferase [Eubacterium sp.]